MKTLPDYIGHGLRILSVGLNPSTISVEKGFYFANPRNRFWKALNVSGLIPGEVVPSRPAQATLFNEYGIGFTDVVKRHSSMGKYLKAEDYRKWVPQLKGKIERYRPVICWFHGKLAIRNYLKYSNSGEVEVEWGRQGFGIHHSIVFVTPNPSPANAVYSLDDIVCWYKELRRLDAGLRR